MTANLERFSCCLNLWLTMGQNWCLRSNAQLFTKLQCMHVEPMAQLVSTHDFVSSVSLACKSFVEISGKAHPLVEGNFSETGLRTFRNFKYSLYFKIRNSVAEKI